MRTINLTYTQCIKFLTLSLQRLIYKFDIKSEEIFFYDKSHKVYANFRLPLLLIPILKDKAENDYLSLSLDIIPSYSIFLITAGYAALGFCNSGELTLHKTIQKYIVRKTQGKAQIKHLREKGKSREGSRIRLQQTIEFFEEINSKFLEWKKEIEKSKFIYYHCSIRLMNEMYLSKTKPIFSREDDRLITLPFDIKKPNLKELNHVNFLINSGILSFSDVNNAETAKILSIIDSINSYKNE